VANNVKDVVAGKPLATGGVWGAPLGTALPTDETTALNVAFKALGYVGSDGLVETADRSTNKVTAWGGDTVKVLQTEFSLSYKFTLLGTVNSDVLEAVHGAANVTTTAATSGSGAKSTVKITSDQIPPQAWVFEIKDGNARIRICVPNGQITSVGDITYADGDAVGYEVTVEAYYDTTLAAQAVKYINDGQPTA